MISIDHYAYTNKFRPVHPVEKFLFSTLTMIICLIWGNPMFYLVVAATILLVLVIGAKISCKFLLKLMVIPLGFLFIGVLTIIVDINFTGPTTYDLLPLFVTDNVSLGVTNAGLVKGIEVTGQSLAIVLCLYFLALTTPMIEIVSVLKRLKVPTLFIELMRLIYRFIYVLAETTENIVLSQSSRCGYASPRSTYRSIGQLVTSLFTRSFHKSQRLFIALSARGFDGDLKVLEPQYRFSRKNLFLIILIELALLITAVKFGG